MYNVHFDKVCYVLKYECRDCDKQCIIIEIGKTVTSGRKCSVIIILQLCIVLHFVGFDYPV